MTLHDEAMALTEYFFHLRSDKMSDYSKIYWPTAKLCAIKCVDELIKYSKGHGFIGLTEHYLDLKQEIENL